MPPRPRQATSVFEQKLRDQRECGNVIYTMEHDALLSSIFLLFVDRRPEAPPSLGSIGGLNGGLPLPVSLAHLSEDHPWSFS